MKTDPLTTFDQFSCYIINFHSCDRTFGPVLGQERLNCLAAICAFENAMQCLYLRYFCMYAYEHILFWNATMLLVNTNSKGLQF